MFREALVIIAGGGLGAVTRYFVGMGVQKWTGPDFPWGTLTVNVLGCFVMGLLVETMALKWNPSPELRAFLTTGILGGFTTFSAFGVDAAALIERPDWGAAALYIGGSVAGALLGLFAGLWLVRAIAA